MSSELEGIAVIFCIYSNEIFVNRLPFVRRGSISFRRKNSNEDKEEAGNSSEKVARGKDTVFKITYLDQVK